MSYTALHVPERGLVAEIEISQYVGLRSLSNVTTLGLPLSSETQTAATCVGESMNVGSNLGCLVGVEVQGLDEYEQ